MATVFCCSSCGAVLTAALRPLEDPLQESFEIGQPRIPRGMYGHASDGWYVFHLEDIVRTKPHSDPDRLIGCCGVAGNYGKTTLCENGHDIGVEHSDCHQAHAMLLDPRSVTLKTVE